MNLRDVYKKYDERKSEIKSRLEDFKANEDLFEELCFCICTPQSKARACDRAIEELGSTGKLMDGNRGQVESVLKKYGVRFFKNKAKYMLETRNKKIKFDREWLVNNIKGLGYKEASHFLRNTGVFDVAILDRHILKLLKDFNVIDEIPKTMTRKKYLEIESKMKSFSENIEIPMEELDLLFWSMKSGEVFK